MMLKLSRILSFLMLTVIPLFQNDTIADSELYSLRIPQLVYDFGIIERGKILTHHFQIHNDGKTPIQIEEIKPSCGCTTATKAPFSIPSGESRQIELKVDTKGRTGKMEQRIGVVTSDPKRRDITFILKGNIQAGAHLDRTVVDFGQARSKKRYKQKIKIVGQSEKPILVKEVQSSIAFLKFKIGKRIKRKNATSIQIILPKNSPVGSFKGWVYIITDEELDPTYWVRVTGEVIAP